MSEALLLLGVLVLFASWYVRIRIFAVADADVVAAELLGDTFVTTQDLLFIHLYRRRFQIHQQFRPKIVAYFWLSVSAGILLLAGSLSYWLAA
jgi:hypothetical protein